MNNLYGLKYDFLHEGGNYLIFWKEEGLGVKELNNIQVKMQLSNSLPKLLLLEIDETDFNVRLRYDYTSKRPLSSFLKVQQLNINKVYQIFLDIVSIINDSKLFMLEENNYLIYQDFIFIDMDSTEVFLIYLPINNLSEKSSVQSELKRIFIYLFNDYPELKMRMYQELIKYFDDDFFSVSDLKQKIVKNFYKQLTNSNTNTSDNKSNDEINNLNIEKKQNKILTKKTVRQSSNRQRAILHLTAALFIAIIWAIFSYKQSEGLFYLNLGLTILIIDIAYFFSRVWKPNIKKEIHINKIEDNTTNLGEIDETVTLKKTKKKIYLQIERDATMEEIEVSTNSFIIGRNPQAANYIENSRGISRVHIEIIEDFNEYLVKDLGSKNGSFLNNKFLIPNKVYPIKNGDVIKLAKTEFKVKEVLTT